MSVLAKVKIILTCFFIFGLEGLEHALIKLILGLRRSTNMVERRKKEERRTEKGSNTAYWKSSYEY